MISCQEENNPQLEGLREFRALRKQHFDLVMKLEALSAETEELETDWKLMSELYKGKL